MKKILILTVLALFVAVIPAKAHAFDLGQLIDPLCVFACNNDKPSKKIITNSYNQNSYNNTNTSVTSNSSSNPVAYCNTCGTTYPTYPTYPSYPQPQSPLGISCYSNPSSGFVGSTITWGSSPYGGNGNYYVTWSGSDGLNGFGTSITKQYNSSGSKYASVTVTSGGQSASANCGNNVQISDSNYNNNYNYTYPNYNYNYNGYPNNNYNYNYNYNNSPLYVSCVANTSFAPVGTNVIWQATVTGGGGYYTYTWSGTDYLVGSGQSTSVIYNASGTKTATVTVYSGNQTITQSCSNSVVVGAQINTNQNLQIACYADKTSARVGTPVTWAVEAIGGSGNYSYSWSGTEGLSSNQSSVVKTYGYTGSKTATVTVTASNGQSSLQSCGNAVTITSATVAHAPTPVKPAATVTNDNDLSASALFSLKNVPWGWVAILIILILFGMIVYLIYNRNKI